MEIINNVIDTEPLATELEDGTTFFYEGSFYLVAHDEISNKTVFINLRNFSCLPEYLFFDDHVKVVKATVTFTN